MFIISDDQANKIASILLEIPAKISLPGLDILRSLQPYSDPNPSPVVEQEKACVDGA